MEVITQSNLDGLTTGWSAKKQVHQSQLHLSSLLKASHACFLTLDQNGLMYGVSSQLSSLLNFQNEEIYGLEFLDLITEDFHDEVNDMISKVQTAGGWISMQIPIYTKDAIKVNTVLHVLTSSETNVDAKEVFVVLEPESTSPGEPAKHSLWMQLGTPTAEMDPNGKITGWNAQMMDLSGLSKEDMIGQSFLDLFTVDAVQKVRRTLRLSREVAGVSTCRTTLIHFQGFHTSFTYMLWHAAMKLDSSSESQLQPNRSTRTRLNAKHHPLQTFPLLMTSAALFLTRLMIRVMSEEGSDPGNAKKVHQLTEAALSCSTLWFQRPPPVLRCFEGFPVRLL